MGVLDTLIGTGGTSLSYKQADNLEIWLHDASSMTPEQFTLSRKDGIGASDVPACVGVAFKTTREELIEEKCRLVYTEEDAKISRLENVRKGTDLEDLNLKKWGKMFGRPQPHKPKPTYAMKDAPWLHINFDGIAISDEGFLVPVECKYVSKYGKKYYAREKADFAEFTRVGEPRGFNTAPSEMVEYFITKAAYYGIPKYYYPQVQIQIAALDAPGGYFSALFDDGWELYVWYIPRDQQAIDFMLRESNEVWSKVIYQRANG